MAKTTAGNTKPFGPDVSDLVDETKSFDSYVKHSSSVETLDKASESRKTELEEKSNTEAVVGGATDSYSKIVEKYEKGEKVKSPLGEVFGDPDTAAQAVTQQVVADLLVSEKPVGTWVDFWEAIDKNVPSIMDGINTAKTYLLAAVDTIEALVDNVKKLLNIVLGIIGKALDMVSLAILLAKAILQAIRTAIKQLLPMFQIPLLKSEMKVAWFNLWDKLTPEPVQKKDGPQLLLSHNIDRMAPFVSSTLNEMCSSWFNRPTAENELCMAMFVPGSFPGETAEFLGKTLDFVELLLQQRKKKDAESGGSYTRYDAQRLLEQLEYMRDHTWSSDTADAQADLKANCKTAMGLLATTAAGVLGRKGNSKTYWGVPPVYKELRKNELNTVKEHNKGFPSALPGILLGAAACNENGVKIELNFANNQSCYISSVYLVKKDTGKTTEVFTDPSFSFAQALVIDRTREFINDMIILFNTAVEWWYTASSHYRLAEEKELWEKLDSDLFGPVFGKNMYKDCSRGYPLQIKTDSDLFFAALKICLSQKEFKNAVSEYESRKQSDLEYSARYTINPAVPRLKPTIRLNTGVEAGDTIVLAFVSDRCKYFSHEFLADGGSKPASYYNLWTPGDFGANMRTMFVSVRVQNVKTARMLEPSWKGIGTPPGVNDWTLGYLFNLIPQAKDIFGIPMRALDTLDAYLDKLSGSIDTTKQFIDSITALFNRYYRIIKDFLAALRKFLLAFGLPSWPSVYVVTWKGGIRDLPGILMSALYQEKLANSTYAGFVLFGSWSGPSEFTEMYKAHVRTKAEWERIKAYHNAVVEDLDRRRDDIENDAKEISKIDWLGLDAYSKKVDAENRQTEAERQKRWKQFWDSINANKEVKTFMQDNESGTVILSADFFAGMPKVSDPRHAEDVQAMDRSQTTAKVIDRAEQGLGLLARETQTKE